MREEAYTEVCVYSTSGVGAGARPKTGLWIVTTDNLAIEVVGAGRVGTALVNALRAAGRSVPDAGGRGSTGEDADVVLLAVPDAALAAAAACIAPGRIVGHLSGATPLDPLRPHERFSLHPLTSIAGAATGVTAAGTPVGAAACSPFTGVAAAVSASSERALRIAEALAAELGMSALQIDEVDRAAYHAAASIASNFVTTILGFAEEVAATTGISREALLPLVTATVRNWAQVGAAEALTGPIARGDTETVERQRAAIATRVPEYTALFDALVTATGRLAEPRTRTREETP